LLLVALAVFLVTQNVVPDWTPAVIAVLLVWPLQRHLRRQGTKVVVSSDKLRYESGLISKSTRTISLAKVQDVSVHQSVGQRITSTGDLAIETAGESSRLTVHNIDRPQAVADQIHDASERAARQNPPPGTGRSQGV
jgi:uncharacterized membrane protein YdbT with pleckstrin-like domain